MTTLLADSVFDGLMIEDNVSALWILLGVVLIFFMQAGFAMVETGFTRAKNAGNIIMKNLMDFCIGAVAFWILGYGLVKGADLGGVIGTPVNPFATDIDWLEFMFMLVFAATSATIVSGAMAERTKFLSYCIYSFIISFIVYPISAHWIWGGGFLANLGFHDFAGSCAVHMVGGVAALIGAKILGPRIGKYKVLPDGKLESKAIPGHSLTLGALGVFILWFCWYGFNGSSTYAFDPVSAFTASRVFVTTTIAPAVATITVMIITWVRYKKPDVSMTLNGTLAGLVAITAGTDLVSPAGSAIIGIVAGFVVVFGIEFIDKKLKIDDPVGAIGVHGMCGALGTILTGVFSMDSGIISGFIYHKGLTAAEAFKFFGVQLLGVVVVIAWVAVTMTATFLILKKTVGLRVSKKEELLGLDITEHGLVSSYADFMPMATAGTLTGTETGEAEYEESDDKPADVTAPAPIEDAVPVKVRSTVVGEKKMSKIVIVANPLKFEELKLAMDKIGITGMTVTNVTGCGVQKGSTGNYYRGVKMDIHLLPKIKMEIVVSKIPVDTVVTAAQKALYTGNFGDGKIFVYDVEDVIKVRTGEHGYDALQDDE